MIKTKKGLLAWYFKKGNEDFGNDLIDLQNNLSNEIKTEKFWDQTELRLTLKKQTWKSSFYLYFHRNNENNIECYRIVY